ncbi:hypothetical protein RRG08_050929 [Elysia crispata]|uniref:Uncharacterized protein n=1 Tax=Elysia crispata TaxID=231223 RepID=A0AAE0YQ77_9GAST|nr:hypothetical protein RRG08_050929 [Elysia crispata]
MSFFFSFVSPSPYESVESLLLFLLCMKSREDTDSLVSTLSAKSAIFMKSESESKMTWDVKSVTAAPGDRSNYLGRAGPTREISGCARPTV